MRRKPNHGEFIICPKSRKGTKRPPVEVWDGTPINGKRVLYGIIGSHSHGFSAPECEYSGMVVRVETD